MERENGFWGTDLFEQLDGLRLKGSEDGTEVPAVRISSLNNSGCVRSSSVRGQAASGVRSAGKRKEEETLCDIVSRIRPSSLSLGDSSMFLTRIR